MLTFIPHIAAEAHVYTKLIFNLLLGTHERSLDEGVPDLILLAPFTILFLLLILLLLKVDFIFFSLFLLSRNPSCKLQPIPDRQLLHLVDLVTTCAVFHLKPEFFWFRLTRHCFALMLSLFPTFVFNQA